MTSEIRRFCSLRCSPGSVAMLSTSSIYSGRRTSPWNIVAIQEHYSVKLFYHMGTSLYDVHVTALHGAAQLLSI
jgi:hypothetical protein